MDYKKASNQQLYEIARNESNRMRDRYMATKELQERRKKNEICRNRPIN